MEKTGDEYIRVGVVQETNTYECLEVRGRLHRTGETIHTIGDRYIRVHTPGGDT